MKNLYLVRHAEAGEATQELSDHHRPLTAHGKQQAQYIASLLNNQNIKPDHIVSSSALRALTTAQLIATALTVPLNKIFVEPRIYGNHVQEIKSILTDIDDEYQTVFLFGHNPSVTWLARDFSDEVQITLPTCGVVGFSFATDHWYDILSAATTLLCVLTPNTASHG